MENLEVTEASFVDSSYRNSTISDSLSFEDPVFSNCSMSHEDDWLKLPNISEYSLKCECGPQEYYKTGYATVGTLFQGVIFFVGVLGNILVCTVVIKTRSMRTTTNCYLVSLAVADTITLITSVPQEVLSYHILAGKWVWGSVGCTLMIYLQVSI